MYEERFYRHAGKPPDLDCYEVKIKETDLLCCTRGDLSGFIEDRVLFYRNQLEEYIRVRPVFRESLAPVEDDALAPLMARRMIVAAAALGVGPMATVAGALAEHVGNDISLFSDEYVIENGGDISLSTRQERVVLIYAGDSPFSGRIGIKVRPDERPYGICTSSATVGPSLSFGKADAVCVVARSALFADGLATKVGNMVKKKEDLSRAIDEGKNFPDVLAVLVVLGDHIGMWGDMELVRI
ncbi:MAG TPA: UPF0280 family protein [Syntrophorhabdaceae bacterium]|jgi:hypothetical protein